MFLSESIGIGLRDHSLGLHGRRLDAKRELESAFSVGCMGRRVKGHVRERAGGGGRTANVPGRDEPGGSIAPLIPPPVIRRARHMEPAKSRVRGRWGRGGKTVYAHGLAAVCPPFPLSLHGASLLPLCHLHGRISRIKSLQRSRVADEVLCQDTVGKQSTVGCI